MIDIVNAILHRNGEILVVKRSSARKAYPNTWSFPGGHVEQDETLEDALERELMEELSVAPREFSLLAVIDDPNTRGENAIRYHMFLVTGWDRGEPVISDDEHCDMAWMTADCAADLADLALSEYREVLMKLRT